jgi:DNA-binding transcriptional LysR family regulator
MGVQPLRTGEADLAIVGGVDEPTDFPSDEMLALEGVLVSAPRLVSGLPRPVRVAELERHDLLAMRYPPDVWRRWLDAVGHPELEPRISSRFDAAHVMYEAVASGLGIGLAIPLTGERYLREGRFAPCTEHREPLGMSYRLVYRTPEAARRPAAARFRDWLMAEAVASAHAFRALTTPATPSV